MSIDEWEYLFNKRENANKRWTWAVVAGTGGVLLLPDVWTAPDGITIVFEKSLAYEKNLFDNVTWIAMEEAGAVFLPAGGSRAPTYGEGGTKLEPTSYYGIGCHYLVFHP